MKQGLGEIFTVLILGTAALPITEFEDSHAPAHPAPRHLEEVAYDSKTNRFFVFGGVELQETAWIEPPDLYERNSARWRKTTAEGPCGRRGHALIFDQYKEQLLVVGGITKGQSSDSVLFDTWAWNGEMWKMIDSNCPVKEPRGVYDFVQDRLLVYGDRNNLHR
jgi:hypothetical protein